MATINQRNELLRESNSINDPDVITNNNVSLQIAYSVRYVELTRPIAGAFLGGIDYELAQFTNLTNSNLILVGNTIGNCIAWLVGEQIIHRLCVYFTLYTETNSKNPLFRNFKTLASLGVSLGTICATLSTTSMDLKIAITIYSASASFILGLSAFVFRWYRQSLPLLPENKKNTDAQVGTEGWSKYSKIALVFGASIGQSIGAYLSYVGGCDATTSWGNITIYGAIAATISFFVAVILVPIVNYLTRDQADETARGIWVTNNREIFNTNYIRTGMTLGVAIGTILGGLLGPALFSGLSASLGIAIGAGFFSIISGLGLGLYGYKLSLYLQKNWGLSVNSDNSWSYASRNTSYVFGFIGSAVACILCPGAALLQSAAIGSSISGLVGWFAGLGVIWKARQVEPDEEKTKATGLPWTQRIAIGASRGSTIGAFVGLILGLCSGGSLGLVGWISLASALGGISGSIIEGTADPVAQNLISKAFHGDSNTPIPGDDWLDNTSNSRCNPEPEVIPLPLVDNSIVNQASEACTISAATASPTRYFSHRNLLFSSTRPGAKDCSSNLIQRNSSGFSCV